MRRRLFVGFTLGLQIMARPERLRLVLLRDPQAMEFNISRGDGCFRSFPRDVPMRRHADC
jgi:hypothetical protein